MTSIVIIARAFPEPETYQVEVHREAPRCPDCDFDLMVKLGNLLRRKNGQWYLMELWKCDYCRAEESFFPGMYGSDDVDMTPEQYADYQAAEHQKERLVARYGTGRPRTIRDYWVKS